MPYPWVLLVECVSSPSSWHVRDGSIGFILFFLVCFSGHLAACSGPIPEALGRLSKLEKLKIYDNRLTGTPFNRFYVELRPISAWVARTMWLIGYAFIAVLSHDEDAMCFISKK